jgi:hypothetical protein
MARNADKYALYQEAVQDPPSDVAFLTRTFGDTFGREPFLLHEDFCGTGALCCEWVRSDPRRRAVGIDNDPEPLEWGRLHNVGRLRAVEQARVALQEGDARSVLREKADVVTALNFSYFLLTERATLRDYIASAYANLAPEGLLAVDIVGGSAMQSEDTRDITEFDGFEYLWEQHSFDPITARQSCSISFRFPDRSRLRDAFAYRWRLWTVPEVRDLMHECGFAHADVYWEGTDPETGEGDGVFRRTEHAESEDTFLAYIVGVRQR